MTFLRRNRYRRQVRVHLQDVTHSLEGVLWTTGRDYLILKAGKLVDESGNTVTLDGDTLIPRERVTFLQAL